jgi:hypothetical protein
MKKFNFKNIMLTVTIGIAIYSIASQSAIIYDNSKFGMMSPDLMFNYILLFFVFPFMILFQFLLMKNFNSNSKGLIFLGQAILIYPLSLFFPGESVLLENGNLPQFNNYFPSPTALFVPVMVLLLAGLGIFMLLEKYWNLKKEV